MRRINRTAAEEGIRPIVFSTLVEDELRGILMKCNGLFLDCFAGLVGPLEVELERRSAHRTGPSHPVADAAYTLRIDAINFALANDDGSGGDYAGADVVLVGVSRSGKTPTCLYMALQYGVFASNYPLTEEELEAGTLPPRLEPHRKKLYGLTIAPGAPAADPRRASAAKPLRVAATSSVRGPLGGGDLSPATALRPSIRRKRSIEEIASRILNEAGVERRLRL